MRGLTGQSTPTPVAADGLLYLATGSQGESNRPVFAVRRAPAATSRWPRAKSRTRSWRGSIRARRLHLVAARLSRPDVRGERQRHPHGVRCATGKEIYKARAGGSGNTFSASPWAADGKIYLLSEDGHTFVIEAGDKYVELAKNSLDEMSFASPALAPDTHLHADADEACIGSAARSPEG